MKSEAANVTRIARAGVDDVRLLAPLFDAYRVFYGQSSDAEGASNFLRARLAKGESVVLLALRENFPVGFVQLYPSFSSVSMKRLWILNDLFVDPAARGRGVGHALLAAAEAHARETLAKGLVLETGKENPAATLYASCGYVLNDAFLHYAKDV
ncbi:MAG: GNAT family N-acetyltransferase [Thermoplasmatota archaeon]